MSKCALDVRFCFAVPSVVMACTTASKGRSSLRLAVATADETAAIDSADDRGKTENSLSQVLVSFDFNLFAG
jgi:hypothetical protein